MIADGALAINGTTSPFFFSHRSTAMVTATAYRSPALLGRFEVPGKSRSLGTGIELLVYAVKHSHIADVSGVADHRH